MKKSIFCMLVVILLTSLFPTNVLAATRQDTSFVSDLGTGIHVTVDYGNTFESMNGLLDISVSGISGDADSIHGIYPGWSIQHYFFGELHDQPAILYVSTSANLPSDVAHLPWNEINYVLNHKIQDPGKTDLEVIQDVQNAIWILLGEQNLSASHQTLQMVAEANAHSDYVPGDGEITAVIVYSDGMSSADTHSVQEAIIEVILHPLPTETATHPAETATPPTETATHPAETATPPTETATHPAETGTPPTETATPPVETTTPPTPTETVTVTPTPPVCQPAVVAADFSQVTVGASVEGMGVVAPGLNIDAKGTAIKVLPGTEPKVYISPNNDPTTLNAGVASNGGFTDAITKSAVQAHLYTFTFAPGVSVSNFSIQMLDFGDYNPTLSANHYASIIAYDAQGLEVTREELNYTTPPVQSPTSSNLYGNLQISGDATGALSGQPGNWIWDVSGNGIVRIVLSFGDGFDPNIGFTLLSFTTTECSPVETTTPPTPTETVTVTPTPPVCQPAVVAADFSQVTVGASVEGMGVVAPGLNIDAKGTAIKVLPGTEPKVYISPNNDPTTLNAGVASNGGFTDAITKSAVQAHLYTFTFAPGVSVSNFSIQMLDFGDYNPTLSANHYASIIAYDAQGLEVTREELNYTTPPVQSPTSSNLYGNLQISGDATGALSGQPGNWIWDVSGNGIVRIVLSFGDGFDPNIGFTLLSFTTTECP